MTISDIKNKIKWRIIALHLIATFFFVLGARQFGVLNDLGIVESVDKYGFQEALSVLVKEDNFSTRYAYFSFWLNISPLIGLLLALLVSLTLTIKRKIFWLNTIIVFVISILLNKLGLYESKIIDAIFFSLGNLFSSVGFQYKFTVNGIILTLVGLFIFLSKRAHKFALNYETNIRTIKE